MTLKPAKRLICGTSAHEARRNCGWLSVEVSEPTGVVPVVVAIPPDFGEGIP